MDKIKSLFLKYKEIIMYLIFGVLTTVVSWVSYALFEMLFDSFVSETELKVALANVLSWVAAVLFAYITNKLWVFDSKSWEKKLLIREIATFVGSRLLTAPLEWVGVPLLVAIGLDGTIFGIDGMIAKVVVSVAVVILNYVFSKLIVFRKPKKRSEKE